MKIHNHWNGSQPQPDERQPTPVQQIIILIGLKSLTHNASDDYCFQNRQSSWDEAVFEPVRLP
jgi:hypothetical protein